MNENLTDTNHGSIQEVVTRSQNPITIVADADRSASTPRSIAPAPNPFPADQQNEWEQVDVGQVPFAKRGLGHSRQTGTAEAAANQIILLPLDKLLPHPLNKKLYGPTTPDEIKVLAESIAGTGQLSPLVVTADLEKVGYYTLLSGHKRADALRSLGHTEARCQEVDVKDADERMVHLLEANRQHVPTTEQKIRIAEVYFGLEARKAKARQVAGAKAARKGGEAVEVFTHPAEPPGKAADEAAGKARDLAAAKVGMSGVSFDKGRKVVSAIDKARQEGHPETAAELRQLLNEKGVDPAHARADLLHLIEKARRNGSSTGKPKVGKGQKQAASQPPPPPAPASREAEANLAVPPPAPPPVAGTAGTVTKPAQDCLQPPSQPDATSGAVVADDPPPVVGVIAACSKLADDLEHLEVADMTNEQKWNLTRAFDAVVEWFGNHERALKIPGQL